MTKELFEGTSTEKQKEAIERMRLVAAEKGKDFEVPPVILGRAVLELKKKDGKSLWITPDGTMYWAEKPKTFLYILGSLAALGLGYYFYKKG